ncbi:MAG: LTA synthase family protein [Planctomycetes bacterium]|nr:LTA synthase family protein [Planctomycetota bacterium]
MRAASFLGTLLLAKVLVLWGLGIQLSAWAWLAYFWQDLLIALLFAAFDLLARRKALGWAAYAVLVLYIAINVPVARVLSSPLTAPMLRAARGTLADSIAHHLTWPNLLCLSLVLAAASLLPVFLRKLERRHVLGGAAVLVPLICLGPMAARRVETLGLHRNALVALALSAFPRLEPGGAASDWRASPFPAAASEDLSRWQGAAEGFSVLMVILESAGAQYLRPYGAAADPMPRLTELSRHALLFENAYCVYPESIKGLFSILCSTYPAVDTAPELYGKVKTPSLAGVLAGAGYRTALFHSGRFMYLGMRSIIDGRGFETLEDAGDIGGNRQSSFGVDEPAAVRRILAWLDQLLEGQRFFIVYLPVAGHHPYETPEKGPFPEDSEVNRYLNALHYGDAALGELIDGLKARRRLDRTLLVIFGDHGEAFGQHRGNFGHTLFIHEENVRVPLLFAAPALFQETVRVRRVASLVDAAPAALALLGMAAPPEYQGRSLLDPGQHLALFYTDYSLGLLGLRDGCFKLVHELDSGRSRLFNLCEDPIGQNDLAARHPERVGAYREHLLRWSAVQRERILSAGINHATN